MQHVYQQGEIALRLINIRSFLIALENNFDDDIANKKREETISFCMCHNIGSSKAI